ncbi:MAG: TlpA family protein disulfide reductase [Bacteroidetes bacterium]|nr:MAG: TlpA family protein disulfide reductase [Bacteroidota bacterium]
MKCTKPAFFCNYLKKKKPLSIFFDFVFVVILILLINPGTRKDVAAFFIRLTSLPPSTLDADEQFTVSHQSEQWNVYNLSLHPVSLETLNEKPVFVNIWATWCPPCIAELPSILDVYETYGDRVNFMLVSNEGSEKVKSFLLKNNYNKAPFYLYDRLPVEFQTESIPTTFILDKNGKVVLKKKGAARWNTGKIKNLLDELLKH